MAPKAVTSNNAGQQALRSSSGETQSDKLRSLPLPRTVLLCAIVIVIASAAVRLVASWDDFWLDEIWTWAFFATQAKSFLQIAIGMRHDNNHILATWIMSLFPADTHWTIYRIPAVVAGTGTVILAGLCGFRRSLCEGLTALLLTGGSFVLIQYSSEARGYAYFMFFTMLCVWLGERISKSWTIRDQWLFALSASVGFSTHFQFVTVYFGLLVWTSITVWRRYRSWNERTSTWLRLHCLPSLTGLILIVGNGTPLISGGGNKVRMANIIVDAASLSLGGPHVGWPIIGWPASLACAVVAIASLYGILLMCRHGETVGFFWAATTLCMAEVVLVLFPETIYVRHFLIEIVGVLLLVSHLLARLWYRSPPGRILYVTLMIAILAGNAVHTSQLLKYGRGGYQAAIAYLLENSTEIPITIGSDFDFRNAMVLQYHYGRLQNPKPIRYFHQQEWPTGGTDWFITHSFDLNPTPQPVVTDRTGNRYRFERMYRYHGLSGWNWMLYRHERKSHQ